MRAPDNTKLKTIRENVVQKTTVYRVSDFVSREDSEQLRVDNARGAKKQAKFDRVDAYIAEMIHRFGWEAYRAWKAGEIDEKEMARLIEADRVADIQR